MSHIGISAFGLSDAVSIDSEVRTVPSECPACVIVPDAPMSPIIVGEESRTARLHSGLGWPQWARVDEKTELRRVPVALAWEMLVEAKDNVARWRKSKLPCAVSDMISAHIRGILDEVIPSSESRVDSCVVAIPNHLDEYAQDALLYSLRSVNKECKLIWRPVAAAMRWLRDIDADAVEEDSELVVAYAGIDTFEVTMFSIKKEKTYGRTYLVPLRKRPQYLPTCSGLDWAFNIAEGINHVCQNDKGALWQAVLRYPDVWRHLQGKKQSNEINPWSTREGWKLWKPHFFESPLKIRSDKNINLSSLCGRNASKLIAGCKDWGNLIRDSLQFALKNPRLRGIIFCGPMARRLGEACGVENFSPKPRIKSIWLPSADCIAEGAALYGERLAKGLPTYLDTLPALQMMYVDDYKVNWADVVAEATIRGGEVYRNTIEGKFQLEAESDILKMYLRKEAEAGEDQTERSAEVNFPEAPQHAVKLKVDVEMRPAAGLAKVVLYPVATDFLDGRGVPFDFRKMRPCAELPRPKRPYPEDLTRKLLGDSSWLIDFDEQRLLQWNVDRARRNRAKVLDDIDELQELKKQVSQTLPSGKIIYYAKINEKGETGNTSCDEVVKKVALVLEECWPLFDNERDAQTFLTRASYLWRAVPYNIQEGFYNIFARPNEYSHFNFIAEAASRCVTTPRHCERFFKTIHSLHSKSNNYAQAVNRLLAYHGPAKKSLDDHLGYYFIDTAIDIVRAEVNSKNIKKKFFSGATLFLMALKQRANNHEFMSADDSPMAQKRYDEMTSLLETAEKLADNPRIEGMIKGIKAYMDYEGEAGLIQSIADEAGI